MGLYRGARGQPHSDRTKESRLLLEAHLEDARSPFWDWFPIIVSLLAAAIAAFAFCPVPRSDTVSGPIALFLAGAYVVITAGVAAVALSVCSVLIAKRRCGVPVRRPLALSCSVAAWFAPMVAFYQRDSLWSASTACVVGAFGAALIHRHRFATVAQAILPESTEAEPETSQSGRPFSLKLAAILLQSGALLILASMARAAALLAGVAVFIISLCYQVAILPSPVRSRYQKTSHAALAIALAMFFVAASLTPYLAVQGEDERSDDVGESAQFSTAKAKYRSEQPPGLLQYVKSLFYASGGEHPRRQGQPAQDDKPAPVTPYPVLQALFGERRPAGEAQLDFLEKKQKNRRSTALVTDESYPGMILRPPIEEHSPITPPVARRRILDAKSSDPKDDPISIPFYGAYWYFRASDGGLPADSIESRGDPTAMSFKTTDFTPIAMEARQSFGALVDLSCCRSVELVISNGDRRPGTVAVELILTNTRLPGSPQQSLGTCPVNSSLHWTAFNDPPPRTETLNFRVPSHAAIRSFDEATIRFHMGSPRERWSAKIAVVKFRLIPRGL